MGAGRQTLTAPIERKIPARAVWIDDAGVDAVDRELRAAGVVEAVAEPANASALERARGRRADRVRVAEATAVAPGFPLAPR